MGKAAKTEGFSIGRMKKAFNGFTKNREETESSDAVETAEATETAESVDDGLNDQLVDSLRKARQEYYVDRDEVLANPINYFRYDIYAENPEIVQLACSIQQSGIHEPIKVRRADKSENREGYSFVILDGDRRFFASGLGEKPMAEVNVMIIEDPDEINKLEIQAVTAIHKRKEVSAMSMSELFKNMDMNKEDIAKKVGMTIRNVDRYFSLNMLDDKFKNACKQPSVYRLDNGEVKST